MKEVRIRMNLEWQMKETYWIYMTWDYIWLSRKWHWIKEKNLENTLKSTCKWYGEEKNSQFSSVAQSWLTVGNPMDCSTPGFPVYHHLQELTQTHVHWVGDAIQPSHPLSSPTPSSFNLSQHQGLFQWVSSLHQVTKVLELQLQYWFFQWMFRTDFL